MKKSIVFASAFALLSLTGCQTEQATPSSSKTYDYTFEIETSKALIGQTCIKWEEGDYIGTYAGGLNNNAGAITIGNPCTFTVKTLNPLMEGSRIYAYYPYSEGSGSDPKSVSLSIPAAQTIDAAGFDADAMPMAAVPYTVSGGIEPNTDTPVGGINFRNLGSIIRFNLYSNGTVAAGDKIQSLKFIADKNICGSYTADLTVVEASLAEVSGGTTVESSFAEPAEVPASKEEAVVCEMVVAPVTAGGTIIVKTDNATYAKTVAEKTYERNALKPLGLSLATMTDITVKFGVEGVQSLKNGESVDYSLTVSDALTDLSVKSAPEGWTAGLNGKTLTVTAPAADDKALEGDIVLQGLGLEVGTLQVRLRGINSKADLLAFRAAHGGKDAEHTELIKDLEKYNASIAPYKVDGWITLNADIEAIKGEEFTNSYTNFIHRIKEPIDGGGHTINLDVTGKNTAAILSFFQHIDASLKNLNFAGQMTQTAKDACAFATLAQQVSAAGVTIENVNSSVNLTTGKANCKVGGLISRGSAVETTMKDCSYSGTITVTAATNQIGGLVGANEVAGTGNIGPFTIDGCTFSGKVDYKSAAHHASSRFGGIVGDQGRNAVIKNCLSSGTMTFSLQNVKIAAADGCGIGGIVGRCNATNPSYSMFTTIKDSQFSGKIVFNDVNPDQPTTYIGKIIGTKLNGYQEAASTGNDDTAGEIIYNYPDPVGTVAFDDDADLSFAYGQTQEIAITTTKMMTLEAVAAPKGWTIDFTNWKSGSISVTAPESGEGAIDGAIELSLKGKDETGVTAYSANTKYIRLFGLNNAAEVTAFTKIYGNASDSPVTGDAIAPYVVNGELTLNADITIAAGDIAAKAYWLKNLVLPLNGNSHTLTYTTTHVYRGGLVQNLKADVHDLNLAGSITLTNPGSTAIQAGGVACANYKNGVLIKNVSSAVTITVSGTQTGNLTNYIGGLVGNTSAENYTTNFENCKVSGNITYSLPMAANIGGIMAWTRAGKPGGVTNMTGCSHSGKINVTLKADKKDIRVGGLMGDSQRKAILTSCVNSGDITIDCGGFGYSTSNGGTGCGLGGVIGRQGAQVAGYDMTCKITDCTNSGKISLLNAVKNDFNVESNGTNGCVGQFVGKNLNYGLTYSEEGTCTKSGSVVITYVEE